MIGNQREVPTIQVRMKVFYPENETFVDGCSHPETRSGHACTSDGNIMYIHGGQNEFSRRAVAGLLGASEVCTAEFLSFDMATLTCKVVTPNYRQPPSGGFFGVSLPRTTFICCAPTTLWSTWTEG